MVMNYQENTNILTNPTEFKRPVSESGKMVSESFHARCGFAIHNGYLTNLQSARLQIALISATDCKSVASVEMQD